MSRSLNQVTIIGNVGKDPEIKEVSGVKVATFSVATSTGGYKKEDGTEVPEKTQWHNIVAWRGLAALAEKAIKKGDKVMVLGSIIYRDYEKDGQKHYVTDIVAYDLILSGKGEMTSTRPPQHTEADIPAPEDVPPMPQSSDLPF
jgi:single-strand DNA-binding protein